MKHESTKLVVLLYTDGFDSTFYLCFYFKYVFLCWSSTVKIPSLHTLSIVHNRCRLLWVLFFFPLQCFAYVSHCINITLKPGMATAELVMKCNANVREHSKLPAQHSCSSAVMEDLVIRKCITLCKALSDAAVTAVIKDFSVHLLKQTFFMQFKGHLNTLYA